MNLFTFLIDAILVAMTYFKTESITSTVVAVAIALVGYILAQDSSKPFRHAAGVFSIALIASFIFFFGAVVKCIVQSLSNTVLVGMKNDIQKLGEDLTIGSTPPFNITGDGPTDLTIFIFGFAALQILLPLLYWMFRRIFSFILN
ncbi:hypothetical protein BCS84_10840 [Vibrio cyclitrophicus]|uniref:hypothetical protein n=1 Tax=Vibrio TaxID=662 RepID=UPI000364108E|nr:MULTISPECIES: hypothetical protein [Vibrio]KNH12770.1 hypothetical protein ACS79_10915 [Vibrio lentus]MBE8555906.1 hypothetical protein [Vibrio sp. OPT24]OED88982.1 hypothetical protein OAQ_19320 [Vibrio cyclitrophicus ZF30]OEE12479.1 hypothetical protein OC1_14480 [Vibrio cyclitrophicus ZF207]PME27949.1 hypothetical protein BCV41_03305 [Vibrio cyclitrophicus]